MKSPSRTTVAMLLALMLSGSALAAQQTTPPAVSRDKASAITSSQSSFLSVTDSQVRIVRLSDATGDVQMDRNAGRGFEPALPNMPVTQGAKLRTGAGLAEVEFEDNSTLRLAPNTAVEFPQLELLQSGAMASTVNVEGGTAYVSLARTTGNQFTLTFGQQKILPAPSSHIRLHLGPTRARLAVFAGNVQVEELTSTIAVGKNKTVTFDVANSSEPILTKGLAQGRYDYWDRAAINYHNRNVNSSAYGNLPYAFGLRDMSYYGGFVNASGCHRMWRPYFVSAAWYPYTNGTWVWYPGSGWTWVSPYPWGWTPYHFGVWENCPAYGWGWRPLGHWRGLANIPKPRQPRPGLPPLPRPPKPPGAGVPTVVAVNRKPLVASGLSSPDRFVIREDSAGLGVPRTLGKLNHMSEEVEQHGSTNLAVKSAAIAGNSAPVIVENGRESRSAPTSSERTSASRTGTTSYSGGRSSAASSSSGPARGYSAAEMGGGAASGGSTSMGGGGGGRK